MADVLGILGFALHAAHKIYDIVETIKDAPEEIRGLQTQASLVRAFLPDLISALEHDRHHSSYSHGIQLEILVKQATDLKASVDKFVGKVTKERTDGSHEIRKLAYLFRASGGQELREQFKEFLTLLNAVNTSRLVRVVSFSSQQLQSNIQSGFDTLLTTQSSLTASQEAHRNAIQALVERSIQSAALRQKRGNSQLFDEISMLSGKRAGLPHTQPSLAASLARENERRLEMDPSFDTEGGQAVFRYQFAENDYSTTNTLECPKHCRCCCHRSHPLIPKSLSPWIGNVYVPQTMLSSLLDTPNRCNDPICNRGRKNLMTIQYFLPSWFVAIEAKIRFQSFPLHFHLQTPRVVETFVLGTDLDEVKWMLSTRRITLNDTLPNGFTILHHAIWRTAVEPKYAYPVVNYLLDAGPPELVYKTLNFCEWALYVSQLRWNGFKSRKEAIQAFQANLAIPYFREDIPEIWESLQVKMRWTKVHMLFVGLDLPSISLDELNILLPNCASLLNTPDIFTNTPLRYAISAYPDAVEPLLRAGANPRLGFGNNSALLDAVQTGRPSVIGALIRAGADINAIDINGCTPLVHALHGDGGLTEILRHGRHLLNDLSRVDRAYIVAAGTDSPATSLIAAGLRGDYDVIGKLIREDAAVNELDEFGWTLLHLVAVGGRIPNAYKVVLEIVRHGGYGIDWEARTPGGDTVLDLARERAARENSSAEERTGAEDILRLVTERRLPPGEKYVFPCMDPDYCWKCSTNLCNCREEDEIRMPGSFRH